MAGCRAISLTLTTLISNLEGRRMLKDSLTGSPGGAASLGTRLAETLLDRGGREILAALYGRPLDF